MKIQELQSLIESFLMTISQKLLRFGKLAAKKTWLGFCDFLLVIFGLGIVGIALTTLLGILGGISIFVFNIPVKAWHECIPLGIVSMLLIYIIVSIVWGATRFWKKVAQMWKDIDNL